MKKLPAYNAWVYFAMTAVSLTALSYFSLGTAWAWGFGLLGLVSPTLWALLQSSSLPPSRWNWFQAEELPKGIAVPWLLLAALAVFVRLFHLTSLMAWPSFDDGLYSFASLELSKEWHWKFFFTIPQSPPLFNWLLSLFYRIWPPSLFSLWLFPALISIATALCSYFVARTFFSRTFSLLFFSLFAFSFWHLYTGTFCQYVVLVFLWEILSLGALGLFLGRADHPGGLKSAALLGFLTGAGLFVGINWPVMLVLVTGTVYAWSLQRTRPIAQQVWMWFLGPVLLFSLLFFAACYGGHYGQYIRQLWIGEGNINWGRQIQDCFCYLSTLFFQPGKDYWHWVVWGGMFNPLAGALFLTGLLEVWRARKSPFSRWLLVAMALSFLPGLVARNFEIYRILLLFPLMLVPCVMGILALGTRLSGVKKLALISGFLLLSSGLDLYHLWGPYHQAWGIPNSGWSAMKSEPLYRAYQVLDQNFRPQGPGAVLSDLFPYSTDETLTTATYPFNAAQNPSLSLASVQWVALLLDPDFKPFLSRRFPSAHWFWLGILPPPIKAASPFA